MTFTTQIKGHGDLNAMGIVVPAAVAQALGSKSAKVVVTRNGCCCRLTLAVMGGGFYGKDGAKPHPMSVCKAVFHDKMRRAKRWLWGF